MKTFLAVVAFVGASALLVAVAYGVQQALTTEWDPEIEPYVAFVEETRGLEFREPVAVVRTDVTADLARRNDADDAAMDDVVPVEDIPFDPTVEAYRLLGLMGHIEDIDDAYEGVVEQGAIAFYDPDDRTIVLPEGPIGPALEMTIVHELTHALQDQHGLLSFNDIESTSANSLRLALVEGDAELVGYAWYAGLPADQQAIVDNGPSAAGWNDYLNATFAAPYVLGPPLIESIIAESGPAELDRLLRSKSLGSDERLVDPLSSTPTPNSDTEAESLMVDPDGNQWFDGWIGAFGWYHALAPSVGAERALTAVRGFDDDVFVTFERDGQVCARFDVWFDSVNDANEFVGAVREWGVTVGGVNDSLSSARFDLCEPVGDPAQQTDDLMTPLMVNHWMAVEHRASGASVDVAGCAAVAQAGASGFDDITEIDWDRLSLEGSAARSGCGAG